MTPKGHEGTQYAHPLLRADPGFAGQGQEITPAGLAYHSEPIFLNKENPPGQPLVLVLGHSSSMSWERLPL